MYSYVTKDRKVLDWKFTKFDDGYNFHVGDIFIGQLFKPYRRKRGWDAVSWANPGNHVKGFISREAGAEHLITVYRKEDWKEK
jgi:hypothetical protein